MNPPTASDPGLGGKAKLRGIEDDIQTVLVKILQDNGKDHEEIFQTIKISTYRLY